MRGDILHCTRNKYRENGIGGLKQTKISLSEKLIQKRESIIIEIYLLIWNSEIKEEFI